MFGDACCVVKLINHEDTKDNNDQFIVILCVFASWWLILPDALRSLRFTISVFCRVEKTAGAP